MYKAGKTWHCKFTCAGCNTCYVGETIRHFSRRVKEHLASDDDIQKEQPPLNQQLHHVNIKLSQ